MFKLTLFTHFSFLIAPELYSIEQYVKMEAFKMDGATIQKYKDTAKRILRMSFPNMRESDFDEAIDYSINKRYQEHPAQVVNNYKNQTINLTLLEVADYIFSREPILTGYGVMFKKHGTVPNPLAKVIQSFLDNRDKDKKMMFTFEKGSEDYEHWNLIQALDKIDANGVFGILTMCASLVYNIHVGASILAQSRSQISELSMLFEMFLANNVKFGSLDEIVVYIDNIVQERSQRKFNDRDVLDADVPLHQVFGHLIMMCGWLWIPDEEDMQIIWDILQNLPQDDLNRIYYKNNLYEFVSNTSMKNALYQIMHELNEPYLNPMKPPKEIEPELDLYRDLILEYVYYSYMIPDRVDRNANMIKSVIMISDTDSCIISLDAWYRYGLSIVGDERLKISKIVVDPFKKIDDNDKDDNTGAWIKPFEEFEQEYDYDFYNDEVIEKEHWVNPTVFLPQDNVRYSLINIMCYVLDRVVNDHMVKFTKANFSFAEGKKCKIIAKNEFLFRRALLSDGKKNYASYQEIQEGNFIPEDEALDVKGLQALTKSSSPDSTKDALKKILLEDILTADNIDQLKIIKDLAIVEHKIVDSITSGSKEYYKPVNIKSMASYDEPMRQQGIKASVVWNELRTGDLDIIDLDARNHIEVAKIDLDNNTVERLRGYPEVYEKAKALLERPEFKKDGRIKAIAIPTTEKVPDWVIEVVNVNELVSDNIKGFPLESVCIDRFNKPVTLSNIVQL